MKDNFLITLVLADRRATTGAPGVPDPCAFFKNVKVPFFLKTFGTISCTFAE